MEEAIFACQQEGLRLFGSDASLFHMIDDLVQIGNLLCDGAAD
jgi:hypothetical protein